MFTLLAVVCQNEIPATVVLDVEACHEIGNINMQRRFSMTSKVNFFLKKSGFSLKRDCEYKYYIINNHNILDSYFQTQISGHVFREEFNNQFF